MIDLPNLRSAPEVMLLALRISACGTLYLAAMPESVLPLLTRMRGEVVGDLPGALDGASPDRVGVDIVLDLGRHRLAQRYLGIDLACVRAPVRSTFIGRDGHFVSIVEVLIGS